MNNIGSIMQTCIESKWGDSPIAHLRALIERMDKDLMQYKAKYPDSLTGINKRAKTINELDSICKKMEEIEPIDVWKTIKESIKSAEHHEFDPEIALVYIPLKANNPEYSTARKAIIDLCGYNFENPRDYEYYQGRLYQEYIKSF